MGHVQSLFAPDKPSYTLERKFYVYIDINLAGESVYVLTEFL